MLHVIIIYPVSGGHSITVVLCVGVCANATVHMQMIIQTGWFSTLLHVSLCCIHSSIKIHDLQDLKEVYTIISVEEEKGASNLAMNTLPLLLVVLGPKCAEIVSQFEVAHYEQLNSRVS